MYSLKMLLLYFIIPILSKADEVSSVNVVTEPERFLPTVVIALFVRNKAHTLPFFLTALEQLEYPKDRIALWIKSDHNEDNSLSILRLWLPTVEGRYHSIEAELNTSPPTRFKDEIDVGHWSTSRFLHMIRLREDALHYARNSWADFIWFLDSDAFIINKLTLKDMVSLDLTVVAPMLRSDGLYSNFWCGMSDDFYYIRTEEYKPILYRERKGCFAIPMVHSAVLINLRHKDSEVLTFVSSNIPDYDGPEDDIITFALSAKHYGVPLYVCNEENYGYITVPLEDNQSLEYDQVQVTNIKLEALVEQQGLPLSTLLSRFVTPPAKDAASFDEIFMINLKRRPERRIRMRRCFTELGLQATEVDAVDGRLLNDSVLQELGIQMLPEYMDPYHKRPLTMGEIGCFLSHYKIWKQVVERGLNQVMVLEDDIKFEPFFRAKMTNLLEDLNHRDWDLVYLGRKRLQEGEEPWVEGSRQLVWAGYSYWTLGYLLSLNGARKLLDADPLSKLLPVDEFLPVLFDKHPEFTWKAHFHNRNLLGMSVAPLLVYPTHYTGEEGYVSDTEDSILILDDEEPTNELPARDDL